MIKSTVEILEKAREELCGILDQLACMFGLEDELYTDLLKVESKLTVIASRLSNPITQQGEEK